MNKKKIIISNYDSLDNPYYGGGGSIQSHLLAQSLVSTYDVTVVCGAYPGAKNKIIHNVTYHYIGFRKAGPIVGQILFSLLLPIYALKETYDLWIENFVPPHSSNFIPLFSKKPVIGVSTISNAEDFSKKYHIPFHVIEKFGISTYKHIIALTNETKNKMRKINPRADIAIIPPAIDTDRFTRTSTEKDFVLYMGRLDIYQKGLDVLIKAWKEIEPMRGKTKLYIAGSGTKKDTEFIKKLIEENRVSKSIKLLGKISGARKKQYLSSCRFFIAPSRFETFGISILEAMASGKAVICTDIDGYRWIPSDAAIKAVPGDIQSLVHAFQIFIADPRKKNSIAQYALRCISKKYSLRVTLKKYQEYIADVMGNVHSYDENSKSKSLIFFIVDAIRKAFSQKNFAIHTPPRKIGKYTFLRQIAKESAFNDFYVSCYENGRSNVFVKSWIGSQNALQFYFLKNEFNTSKILYQKLRQTGAALKIPRPLEWIENDQCASAIYEYVNGKNLSSYPVTFQLQVYQNIWSELQKVSLVLSNHEKSFFIKRKT
ncbi:glycosyltransferase family 4 protein, partial [Candidatus Roizmanbacteria bacterium]|nr:glycosyltransferase family 4 protein [Candidatus Roizmanbacteria bacterium]